MNVLFLCTGNSCRSILAEATFNHLAPAGWKAMSAGSKPAGQVHPRSLALLAREGISTDGLFSKSWDNLPQTPDIVVTVCSSAASETCPAYLGPVLRTHWGVEDPAHATGTDAEIDAAFETAYRILRARIEGFFALPLAELKHDPARLKAELAILSTPQEPAVESQFVLSVRKSAEESFASGLYCAESVVLALAKAQGIESELLPRMATAFCSGMARTCGTCGALTGAVMGVSLALGRSEASESVQPSYTATQRLIREFEQEFGARDCNVLLGCDLNTSEGQATFRENRLDERCAKYTSKAAEIAARIVSESRS